MVHRWQVGLSRFEIFHVNLFFNKNHTLFSRKLAINTTNIVLDIAVLHISPKRSSKFVVSTSHHMSLYLVQLGYDFIA